MSTGAEESEGDCSGLRDPSLRETAYLMRSPANARRLLDAMERLENGRGEARDVIDTA